MTCLNSIETSYRTELGEFFDAHFGRFEEKLERRLTDTTANLGNRIEQLRANVDLKIEQLRVELHSTRTDMLKWSLGLWVPVALAVIGLSFKP